MPPVDKGLSGRRVAFVPSKCMWHPTKLEFKPFETSVARSLRQFDFAVSPQL